MARVEDEELRRKLTHYVYRERLIAIEISGDDLRNMDLRPDLFMDGFWTKCSWPGRTATWEDAKLNCAMPESWQQRKFFI